MKKVTILIRGIVTLYSLGSIIQQLIQVFRHFSSSFVAFGKKKGQLPQRGGQFVVAYAIMHLLTIRSTYFTPRIYAIIVMMVSEKEHCIKLILVM